MLQHGGQHLSCSREGSRLKSLLMVRWEFLRVNLYKDVKMVYTISLSRVF